MNLLEHYLTKVHDVRPCNEEWAVGKKLLYVTATFECYGRKSTTTDIYKEEEWEDIKEKGYCMR